jgi:hypothetical protein
VIFIFKWINIQILIKLINFKTYNGFIAKLVKATPF